MIVNQIVEIIGEYTPIVVDGTVCTNWGQVAAYALIYSVTVILFSVIGRLVCRR